MRVPTIERRRRRPFRVRGWMVAVLVLLVVLLLSLRGLAGLYTDFLWFDSVGFSDTWWGLVGARLVPALVFGVIAFGVVFASLTIADRIAPRARTMGPEDELIARYQQFAGRYARRIRLAVAAFLGLILGSGVSSQWQEWILFRNRVDFGVEDPQFGLDVGFYVFQLPFLTFAADWAFTLFGFVLFVTLVAHYLNGGIRFQSPFQRVTPQVKAHVSVILGLMALAKAVQYWLDRYELNFSTTGVVEGAGKTDVAAQLPALNLLIIISLVAAALFLVNIRLRGWVLPIIAVGLWALIALVVGTIYPAAYQRLRVNPNELTSERPYIERNIDATRNAFGLDEVEVLDFNYQENLDQTAIAENRQTIDNARLWDPPQIRDNYQAFQQLGTFYQFDDVDVDRYAVGGRTTQVMLSARELNREDLPSQSWVNRNLVYTHGYGSVVSPANAANADGQPDYLLENIPPVGDIQLDQPELYFGEGLGGFALVDSKEEEFNFQTESGQEEFTRYGGSGGVEMSSWLRRAAFALRFADFNVLISGQVTPETRILYLRDIVDRVQTAAPFLHFDSDPYPVILDGEVQWVLDGMTTSDEYPYSQSFTGSGGLSSSFNYVRNSVKAVVDGYDGTITFYVIDDEDPVIRAYRQAFPDLFTDGDEAPEELVAHYRYPEDLFKAQTDVYTQYHMTNPTTFYNRTDLWEISPDPGTGEVGLTGAFDGTAPVSTSTTAPEAARSTGIRADPVYLLIRLPDQEQEDFLMLRPFVPVSRGDALTNLVSFMVAKSDPDDYGELQSFVMPSGSTVDGPEQVNQTIATTEEISRQYSLLGRTGSRVIQGSLQLIPINDSILYIRPVYVQGESGSRRPSFRQVVVWYNGTAVIDDTVDDALLQLFGVAAPEPVPDEDTPTDPDDPTTTTTAPPDTSPPADGDAAALLDQALDVYDQAQAALANGDLGEYDRLIEEFARLVEQARQAAGGTDGVSTGSAAVP